MGWSTTSSVWSGEYGKPTTAVKSVAGYSDIKESA